MDKQQNNTFPPGAMSSLSRAGRLSRWGSYPRLTGSFLETDVPDIDLHKLAKLPFGAAERELKRLGFWDEYAGNEMKRYKVVAQYSVNYTETAVLYVEARCQEEADEKAGDEIEQEYRGEIIEADIEEAGPCA